MKVYGGATLGANTFTGAQTFNGGVTIAAGLGLDWAGRTSIASPADGLMRITNNAGTAGVRLDVTTDAILNVTEKGAATRAQVNGLIMAITDGITAPSATVGLAKIFVDTSDGDLKVIFGDGTTKLIVADT